MKRLFAFLLCFAMALLCACGATGATAPTLTEDKPRLHNCELKTYIVRGEALCRECGALYNVLRAEGACPKCHSREKKILGGQEFVIKEIAY